MLTMSPDRTTSKSTCVGQSVAKSKQTTVPGKLKDSTVVGNGSTPDLLDATRSATIITISDSCKATHSYTNLHDCHTANRGLRTHAVLNSNMTRPTHPRGCWRAYPIGLAVAHIASGRDSYGRIPDLQHSTSHLLTSLVLVVKLVTAQER